MTNGIWLLIILVLVAAFLIYATKKRWISWKGGNGISYLTAFHDFQTKDKQEAIEYVMEEKAGKKMEEQESGEDKNDKAVEKTSVEAVNDLQNKHRKNLNI